ncbi:30S ribosomal protein S4e [Candidatus Woesearchaeota archaeon]|nr:30S ribosomal protein S4e [Candidatus Woesearchaeota archaeon]
MAKNHLKRVSAPASWPVGRKEGKLIARPKGSFSLEMGMPLVTALKDVLGLVKTRKEGKLVLNTKSILVNGKRRKDEKFMIGLMDVISISDLGKSYRMLLDKNGILRLVPVSGAESSVKLCRVIGKRAVKKGRLQLSLHDGRSCIGAAAHSVGDTLVLGLQKNDVVQHIKLEEGCNAYIIGGSNVGRTGVVEHISGNLVTVRIGDEVADVAKRFVFVIGKGKPMITNTAA